MIIDIIEKYHKKAKVKYLEKNKNFIGFLDIIISINFNLVQNITINLIYIITVIFHLI